MRGIKFVAPFLGHTGYNTHARGFASALDKLIPVSVYNYTADDNPYYLTQQHKLMLSRVVSQDSPVIVLSETHRDKLHQDYHGIPKIIYNVWESTKQYPNVMERMFNYYDQVWVPSEWQRCCYEKQAKEMGLDTSKLRVVHEGIDPNIYNSKDVNRTEGPFKFLVVGKWEWRKCTTEIIEHFNLIFGDDPNVQLLLLVDNPWSSISSKKLLDMLFSGKIPNNIKYLESCSDEEYVKLLKTVNCVVSCSRSEGWGLPQLEAIACGTVTIISDCAAQTEYSDFAITVSASKLIAARYNDGSPCVGEYYDPDFKDLCEKMSYVYNNYDKVQSIFNNRSALVCDKFSWDRAAEKAFSYICESSDIEHSIRGDKNIIKLNIGCGEFPLSGYINVDRYHPDAEVKTDLFEIPYYDNSVDVINMTHVLEHFGKNEISKVLKFLHRKLKPGGSLIIEVPDLPRILDKWIDVYKKGNEDPWGFYLDTLFGNQNNPGEYHKTGFDIPRLSRLLSDAGFIIDHAENNIWSHRQDCLVIKASKKADKVDFSDSRKEVIIVGSHADTSEKEDALRNTINQLKSVDKELPIVIVSHIRIPEDIVTLVDDIIVDPRNPHMSPLDYFYNCDEFKLISKLPYDYHALGVLINIHNGCLWAKEYGFSNIHYFEYDADIDFNKHLQNSWRLPQDLIVGYDYEGKGINTTAFSFYVDTLLSLNIWVTSEDQYAKVDNQKIFEYWLLNVIKKHTKNFVILHPSSANLKKDKFKNLPEIMKIICNTVDPNISYIFEIMKDGYKVHESVFVLDQYPENQYVFNNNDYLACKYTDKIIKRTSFDFNLTDGAVVNIYNADGEYDVVIKDGSHEVYRTTLVGNNNNLFAKTSHKYMRDWQVSVFIKNTGNVWNARADLKGKRVLINFDSKSLGDTIAWIPYVEEFQRVHDCDITLFTFWNKLFESVYPTINFIEAGKNVPNLYAIFSIGAFDNDNNRNKYNWRTVPLQQIAADVLGLPFIERKPRIAVNKNKIGKNYAPYVCISEHSTMQAKYWNHPGGWQQIVDYLKYTQDIDVYAISSEKTSLRGVIDCTGRPIEETISNIVDSKFVITLGSGLAWLAWALNKPVIMISGFSAPWTEFTEGNYRVYPQQHPCPMPCYNDLTIPFDRGDWNWCPHKKDFACSKLIYPRQVINIIDKVLSDLTRTSK